MATGREIRKFEGHSYWVNLVAFSPDGKTALSGSGDKTVRLWDLATGREMPELEGRFARVESGCVFAGRQDCAVGEFGPHGKALGSGHGPRDPQARGAFGAVTSVAFSPDGKTALSGSGDHTARLWDLATGREIRKLEGHSNGVCSVAFSPDGKTALSGSETKR